MEQTTEQKALEFATKAHEGQFRNDKKTPYIEHPKRVANLVKLYKKSHRINELIAAALLHDTLEDTNTGIVELVENFGETIALIVIQLTNDEKKKETLGKTKYLSAKLSDPRQVSSWALIIKLADRLDNISDLHLQSKEFRSRYTKETIEIINAIGNNRQLTITHRKLISAIRSKLNYN